MGKVPGRETKIWRAQEEGEGEEREKPAVMCFAGAGRITTQTRLYGEVNR